MKGKKCANPASNPNRASWCCQELIEMPGAGHCRKLKNFQNFSRRF
jgi:hypothetical protein